MYQVSLIFHGLFYVQTFLTVWKILYFHAGYNVSLKSRFDSVGLERCKMLRFASFSSALTVFLNPSDEASCCRYGWVVRQPVQNVQPILSQKSKSKDCIQYDLGWFGKMHFLHHFALWKDYSFFFISFIVIVLVSLVLQNAS